MNDDVVPDLLDNIKIDEQINPNEKPETKANSLVSRLSFNTRLKKVDLKDLRPTLKNQFVSMKAKIEKTIQNNKINDHEAE